MAFAPDSRRLAAACAAIACSAILFWFGNGLNPWWPLLWLAPLPVLLFASRSSWRATALTAFLGSLLGSLNLWHYFFGVLHAPAWVWVLVFASSALIFAAAVLLFRALLLRGAPWSALVALPATWVSFEYLRNLTTPHGTAGSFAYSQLNFLSFLQLASITGPWGMSFLLLLAPSAIAIGFSLRRHSPRQALRIVGMSLGVLFLVLGFGAARLARPASGQQVTVGLIASDRPGNEGVADPGAPTERLFRDYAAVAQTLASAGATVIVLPEKIAVLVDPKAQPSDAIFQSLADTTGATLVAGVVHVAPAAKYNQARVYAPKTAIESYDKRHMLPPFESDLKPGTTLTLLQRGTQTWGVEICKDMDFANPAREYGNAGVGLMLDPAWDFNIDRGWHGHIAIMRGVEDGFSIAHTAKNGYLTVTDDRGRILAETRSDAAPFATLLANVPAAHDRTFYLLAGDWFAWAALGMLVFALVQCIRRKASGRDSQSHLS